LSETGCGIRAETFRLSSVGTARKGFPGRGVKGEEIHNLDGSFLAINGVVRAEGGTTFSRAKW
jgi:hypothetical protein